MTYTKTALLPVTPDEAFALITEPERLRRWQTVSAVVDLRAGGEYRWTVTPGHIAEGTFREVEPGRRVVFGWGWDGNPDLPKDASTVTVTVEPTEAGILVTLVHEGLTPEQAAMHAEGWDHYFDRLERVAGSGDAGPDEWAWAPENLTPLVAAEAALAAVQPVLRNLTTADGESPTPCADFTTDELVEHLLGSLIQVGGMAGAQLEIPAQESAESQVSELADAVITAWRAADLDGTVQLGENQVPAGFLINIVPLEILLHGWDLAQATGQQIRISDEVVDYIREISEPVIVQGRGRSFADEVEADGAAALDRYAALAGRTPLTRSAAE